MKLLLTIVTAFILMGIVFIVCNMLSVRSYVKKGHWIGLFETKWWFPLIGFICGQIAYWVWWWK